MRRRASGAGGALAALLWATTTLAQPEPATPSDATDAAPSSDAGAAAARVAASNADDADPASTEAALAARLGRSLVRVEVGEARGLGVLVGAGRVLTAHALVDNAGALRVTSAAGASLPARVVNWSEATGLALLEPSAAVEGEPLVPTPSDAGIGAEALLPDLTPAPDEGAALVPVLGVGRVSGASAGTLWVDALFGGDDLGRPLVSREGALLGVVVASADRAERSAPGTRARVAAASVLRPLIDSRATRDDFEPTSRAHWQKVSGLVTVPLAHDGLLGAGFQFGWRRDWFVGLIREGFAVNGFAPRNATTYERVQRRAFFELEAEAQLALGRTRLFLGAGAVILADNRERRVIDAGGVIDETREHDIRVRPLATVGMNTDPLEVSLAAYIGSSIETRLGIGLIWGR